MTIIIVLASVYWMVNYDSRAVLTNLLILPHLHPTTLGLTVENKETLGEI